jgi:hypothetical protein
VLEIKQSRAGSNNAYFIPCFLFMFRETGRRVNTEINYTNKIANSHRTWDQTKPELAVLSSSLEIVLLQSIFHEKRRRRKNKRCQRCRNICIDAATVGNGKKKKKL